MTQLETECAPGSLQRRQITPCNLPLPVRFMPTFMGELPHVIRTNSDAEQSTARFDAIEAAKLPVKRWHTDAVRSISQHFQNYWFASDVDAPMTTPCLLSTR